MLLNRVVQICCNENTGSGRAPVTKFVTLTGVVVLWQGVVSRVVASRVCRPARSCKQHLHEEHALLSAWSLLHTHRAGQGILLL